jgi:hypothetical protein
MRTNLDLDRRVVGSPGQPRSTIVHVNRTFSRNLDATSLQRDSEGGITHAANPLEGRCLRTESNVSANIYPVEPLPVGGAVLI